MQAIILAAGKGTRLGPLTQTTPKSLLKISGRPILEHTLSSLPSEISEVIIVIGYRGEMIRERFGDEYQGKRIRYVEQEKLNGTGGSLWLCKPYLKNAFLVMYADDIYSEEDMQKAACFSWSVVGIEVDDLGTASKIVIDGSDRVTNILEVEDRDQSPGFLNTGLYCLDTRIFNYPLVPKNPGSEEYGLPQTVIGADIPLHLIKASFWLQITDPEDVQKAEEMLTKKGHRPKV